MLLIGGSDLSPPETVSWQEQSPQRAFPARNVPYPVMGSVDARPGEGFVPQGWELQSLSPALNADRSTLGTEHAVVGISEIVPRQSVSEMDSMPPENSSISASDFVFLREEIRHEDNLLNQRLSWLVSSQSFLLTGFAIALNGPLQAKFLRFEQLNLALISVLPIVGALVSVVSEITIFAGLIHMRDVRRLAGNFHPPNLPGVQGTALTRRLGLSGPVVTPIIFLLVWLVFLIRQ